MHPGGDGGEKIACARNTEFPEAAQHKAGGGWWRTAKNIHKTGIVYHVLVCEGMNLVVTKHRALKMRAVKNVILDLRKFKNIYFWLVGASVPAASEIFINLLRQHFLIVKCVAGRALKSHLDHPAFQQSSVLVLLIWKVASSPDKLQPFTAGCPTIRWRNIVACEIH